MERLGSPEDRYCEILSRRLSVVVPLWVVAVYLLAGFADLLDDEEVAFGLDDPFDPCVFVSGEDDELVALLHDGLIAGGRNLDRLDAESAAALAVEGKGRGDSVLLRASAR